MKKEYYLRDLREITRVSDTVIWRLISKGVLNPKRKNEKINRSPWVFSYKDIKTIREMQIDNFDGVIQEIPGYPKYYADNQGNIYSNKSNVLKKLTQTKDRDGYYRVCARTKINGLTHTPSVHRLVAITFLGKPEDSLKNSINHIDGDKSNNKPENLEWVTSAENTKHAISIGLRNGVHPKGIKHHLSIPVIVYDENRCKVGFFESQNQACIALGCSKTRVCETLKHGPFEKSVYSKKMNQKLYFVKQNNV